MAKKIKNIIATAVLLLLVAVIVFATIQRISGKSPSIFGYQIYRISSGSMEPELEIGDIILCKQIDIREVHLGDVVTYTATSGELAGQAITHKVIRQTYFENGYYYIETKGIAEGALADDPVREDALLGKMQTKIPLLKHVFNIFLSPFGYILVVALILLAFSKEIFTALSFAIGKKPAAENEEELLEDIEEEKQALAKYLMETTKQDDNEKPKKAPEEEFTEEDLKEPEEKTIEKPENKPESIKEDRLQNKAKEKPYEKGENKRIRLTPNVEQNTIEKVESLTADTKKHENKSNKKAAKKKKNAGNKAGKKTTGSPSAKSTKPLTNTQNKKGDNKKEQSGNRYSTSSYKQQREKKSSKNKNRYK